MSCSGRALCCGGMFHISESCANQCLSMRHLFLRDNNGSFGLLINMFQRCVSCQGAWNQISPSQRKRTGWGCHLQMMLRIVFFLSCYIPFKYQLERMYKKEFARTSFIQFSCLSSLGVGVNRSLLKSSPVIY